MKLAVNFFVIFTLLTPSSFGKSNPLEQNVVIGKNLKANRYSTLYFSSQPSNEDFEALKKQGFTHIVNLRKKFEGSYKESQERAFIQKLGLKYGHVPVSANLNDELIDSITQTVVKHRSEGKTLVHCSSGNRVGMWLGAHFHKDHGQSKEEALQTAQKLGLNKEGAIRSVKAYLESK